MNSWELENQMMSASQFQPHSTPQHSVSFDPQEMHFKNRDYIMENILTIAKTHNTLISGDFIIYQIYYSNIVKKFNEMLETKLAAEGIYSTHSHYTYILQEAFKSKTLFTNYAERHNRFTDTIDIWVHQDDDYIKLYQTIYTTFSTYYLISCSQPSYIQENNTNIDTTRKITRIIINISNPYMFKPIILNIMIDFTPKKYMSLPQTPAQQTDQFIQNPSSMIEMRDLEIPYGFYSHINQYIMFDYSNSLPNSDNTGNSYTVAPALIKHMFDITTPMELTEKTKTMLERINIYIANNMIVLLSFTNTEDLKMIINGRQFNSRKILLYFDLLISGEKSIMFWIVKNNTIQTLDCTECKVSIDIGDYYIQTKCCNRMMHCSCMLDKFINSSFEKCSNEYEKHAISVTCSHCNVTCEDYMSKNTEVLMYFNN
jgi:hypothetical protein